MTSSDVRPFRLKIYATIQMKLVYHHIRELENPPPPSVLPQQCRTTPLVFVFFSLPLLTLKMCLPITFLYGTKGRRFITTNLMFGQNLSTFSNFQHSLYRGGAFLKKADAIQREGISYAAMSFTTINRFYYYDHFYFFQLNCKLFSCFFCGDADEELHFIQQTSSSCRRFFSSYFLKLLIPHIKLPPVLVVMTENNIYIYQQALSLPFHPSYIFAEFS